jgi:hypothetical protein
MVRYAVHFLCNECSEVHPMRIVLALDDGPPARASIGDTYAGKELPPSLATLSRNMITCPKTGKFTSQNDNHQLFLIPLSQRGAA